MTRARLKPRFFMGRGPGARGQGPFPQIPHEPHGTGCESLSFFRPEIELEPLQPNSISKGSQLVR
jgi:hypothetical protein